MGEFRMPSLGADMESGKVIAWHVKPGDRVKRGDIVATVDTSKAEIDVEIFQDGTIEELIVQPGERVPVGTVLATVASEVAEAAPAGVAPAAAPPAPAPSLAPVPAAGAVRATPFARRTAADLGIDLATVAGSGANGAVLARDVRPAEQPAAVASPAEEPAAPPPPPVTPPEEPDRATTMRQAIAAAMARSKREIPHYYLATDIDLTATLDWLAEHNAPLPVAERALAAVPMLKAVALALREFPQLNGYWVDGALQPGPAINLGVAVSMRGGGLIAPAVHGADTLSIDELMAALRDLVKRVRSGGLRSSELTDATLTVTSLGEGGVPAVYGVIYPPQVALVGFGAVTERPWASGGMLGVRRAVTATLAADHRASDGHLGAGFLAAIDRLLQTPEQL